MAFLDFIKNRVLGNVLGFGIGAASAQAFDPVLRPIGYALEREMQNRILSPAELAQLVIRGDLDAGAGASEAAASGYSGERFDLLTRLAGGSPGFAELLELLRRGVIGEGELRRGARQAGIRDEWVPELLELRRALLGAGDAAMLVARGLIDADQGAAIAARQGVGGDDFALMVRERQGAPSLGEILDLLNRGEIDAGEARAALIRNGLEPRYADTVLELRKVLPTPSDVIRFALREVYSERAREEFGLDQEFPSDAVPDAARIGLDRDELAKYWAAHWDLPSPTQGFQMFHRGIITRPQLEQLLKALDYVPAWRGKLIDLAYNVPGRIDLRRMYAEGVITRERVLRGYLDLGYSPDVAAELTRFATALKTTSEKELSKSEVIALFESGEWTREQAAGLLGDLGYDSDETDWILGLAESRRDREYRNAVVSVVRSRYVARQVTEADAAAWLDRVGVGAEQRDRLIDLWTFQQQETPVRLSIAQMQALYLRDEVSEAEFVADMESRGYSREQAEHLIVLALPARRVAERDLTAREYVTLYKRGMLSESELRAELAAKGYDPGEADRLIALATPELTIAQMQKLVKLERISDQEFLADMGRRGFDSEQAAHLLAMSRPKPKPDAG